MALQAPQVPSSQHLQLVKPGFVLNESNYRNDPTARAAIDRYGGWDKYKADLDNYYRAYDKYVLDHAIYNYQRAATGEIQNANMSAYESRLASAYRKYASKLTDPNEKQTYLDLAETHEANKATAKASEDRYDYLRSAAMPVRDQLRNENLSIRDAEFDRLMQQRDSAYETVDKAYKNDLTQLDALKDSGMISDSQYSSIRDTIRTNWSSARDTIKESHIAGRAAATERYDAGKEFYANTYNSIMGGDYEEGRQYALPTYDKELIQISSTYKPRFGEIPKDSKPPVFYGDPVDQSNTETKYIDAGGVKNTPAAGGSGSGGSSIVGGTPVVGDQSGSIKMLDASNLQQTPGLISSADMLTYTPAANLNTGGLIYGQNPQLYNYGSARVRMPGSM